MEMGILWLSVAAVLGGYVFVFGVVKRVNEWYYVSRFGNKIKEHLPPGDLGWPLLGNMWSFFKAFKSTNPDAFINDLVKRYGRTGIYKTYLFNSPSIIVCLPETCKRVLTDDENFKLGYPVSTKALTGKRSFHSITNAEHKRLRKLTSAPISGHEALSLYIEHIETIIVSSLDEWGNMEKIEFLTEMRKIAFKVITHIFLGHMSDESVIEEVEKLYTDLNYGLKSLAINLPGFAFHKALKARKGLVKILQGIVDERKKNGKSDLEGRKDMLGLMMGVEDEDGKLEDEDIIDILLMYLLAGHESSAHATMWVTLYLEQHPEIFQKAKEEQEEILKRRPSTQKGLSLKEIKQMDYAHKVIDEMLRRTSISFAKFREAKADVNINGYVIPKGWKVLVWSRAVHMDKEIYTNPKEFNPSRWDNHKAKAGSFIPFGGGSRLCPGADLAKLEICIFLHYYLLQYKLERTNPDCPLMYLPVARPTDNCVGRMMKVT